MCDTAGVGCETQHCVIFDISFMYYMGLRVAAVVFVNVPRLLIQGSALLISQNMHKI